MLLTFLNTLATIISVISLLIVTYGVLVGFGSFSGFLQELNKKMENSTVKMLIRQIIAIFFLINDSFP